MNFSIFDSIFNDNQSPLGSIYYGEIISSGNSQFLLQNSKLSILNQNKVDKINSTEYLLSIKGYQLINFTNSKFTCSATNLVNNNCMASVIKTLDSSKIFINNTYIEGFNSKNNEIISISQNEFIYINNSSLKKSNLILKEK